jgi:hypothetical protein
VFPYTSSALVEIMAEEADNQNKSVVEETQTLVGASMCSVRTDPTTIAELVGLTFAAPAPGQRSVPGVPGGGYVNSPAKENSMNCPHCHKHISPKLIRLAAGKLNRSKRTAAPNPKILTPCPHCGELRGVRELRAHRPVCPKNPRYCATP